MELGLFNNKTTVNAHSQLLAVQQQQIQQAATAIDIYRHNKGIGGTHQTAREMSVNFANFDNELGE